MGSNPTLSASYFFNELNRKENFKDDNFSLNSGPSSGSAQSEHRRQWRFRYNENDARVDMRPVNEWDESDLASLIKSGEVENTRLEYKASAALGKGDKEKNDMSKDVAAMANAAGGVIIYGIGEKNNKPVPGDKGVNRNTITKEYVESVLDSKIQPPIEGLLIRQIDLSGGAKDAVAYAIEIPPATSRAPHQSFDHKYYKRNNFQVHPMEDWEVRDAMRRSLTFGKKFAVAWNLHLEFQRLLAATGERLKMDSGHHVSRSQLYVTVATSMREAGEAVLLLPKPLRIEVAKLVTNVDQYNSVVETVDPGHRDEARLSGPLKARLSEIEGRAAAIGAEVFKMIENEP